MLTPTFSLKNVFSRKNWERRQCFKFSNFNTKLVFYLLHSTAQAKANKDEQAWERTQLAAQGAWPATAPPGDTHPGPEPRTVSKLKFIHLPFILNGALKPTDLVTLLIWKTWVVPGLFKLCKSKHISKQFKRKTTFAELTTDHQNKVLNTAKLSGAHSVSR